MNFLTVEAEKYRDVWLSVPQYGEHSPGELFVPMFSTVATAGAHVVDAGTGSGRGALALTAAGYHVDCVCDLTADGLVEAARRFRFAEACLWRPLRPQLKLGRTEWVYCVDVLEHLPPQFTMLAVDQMLALAEVGLFLVVTLVPDQWGAVVGETLHRTVEAFTWWRDSLREVGRVVDARDQIQRGVFVVTR